MTSRRDVIAVVWRHRGGTRWFYSDAWLFTASSREFDHVLRSSDPDFIEVFSSLAVRR